MMQPFVFHTPTKINFGEDTICGIGDLLFEMHASRPLLVTDANLIKAGVLKPVLAVLKEAGIENPHIFDEVPADSDVDCCRKAAQIARDNQCDSVIAVGGGSVMDTGKVANIGLSLPGDVLEYEGINTLAGKLQPMIAIPTTAGTGSEVSAVAMVKDHQQGKKLVFGSRFLFPDVAILDPKLLLSLPPKLTAATGLDALTHAIESYVAATTNAPADGLCLEAMRLIFASLPRATANGADLEARSATLIGSMMAGVAFTNAGVGVVHAIAHSLGGKYGTHHGMTNAILLVPGMEFNLSEVADKFGAAYRYLRSTLMSEPAPVGQWFAKDALPGEPAGRMLIAAVKSLITECRLPERLRDLGVPEISEEDLQELAEMSMTDPAMMFNPKPASTEDLMAIIKGAY
ncbi:MAG TPA: iron-containing alcohol dehydrogenase [Candidatus Obscuribacterales bacterium]